MKKNILNHNSGSAALVTLFVFMGISLAIVFAFSAPVIQSSRITAAAYDSKEGYYVAESLTEDVVYRLNNSLSLDASESLSIYDYSATAAITDVSGDKRVEVTGESNGIERTIRANVSTADGVSFSYGVQAGNGGFDISGGSTVNGNVYANGNIVGGGGARITGSAVAADSVPLASNQSNTTPVVPTQSINFRNVAASQDFAQSFQVSTSSAINKVQVFIRKTANPANATVRIVNNNAGSPGTTNIVTGTLTASLVTTSYGWIDVVFPSNPVLTAGTTYWIVIDNSTQNASNYFTIAANSAYASGQAKVGAYSGTWNNTSPVGLDGYFNIYLGGTASTVGGGTYVGALSIGTTGTDLAWGNVVSGVSITGPLYCLTGTNNNKACDTSRPNPSTQPFPISDANIQEWKDGASAGNVITGNVTIGYQGTTTGPLKINGNLTINGGGTFTLTGPLWVTGNVTITSGGSIRLASSYGSLSGTVVSDGLVSISGGGNIAGSGTAGSYILMLTTSSSTNAMAVTGGAGAVILSAQNGTINFSGGTAARAAVANRITLTGGTDITYDSGLQNPNFSSGPSGSWTVNSWQEVE